MEAILESHPPGQRDRQVCDVLLSDYNGLKNWLNINHSNRALGTD